MFPNILELFGLQRALEDQPNSKIKSRRSSGGSDSDDSGYDEGQQNSNASILEFQLTQSLLNQVKAGENNAGANSGGQACLDLHRMSFVINGKRIHQGLITALIRGAENKRIGKEVEPSKLQDLFDSIWQGHCKNKTVPDNEKTESYKVEYEKELEEFYNKGKRCADLLPKDEGENYRLFAKRIFEEMFEYADVPVPNDSLIEELITHCNQAGYDAFLYMQVFPIFIKYELEARNPMEKVVNIDCNLNFISVEYKQLIPIYDTGSTKEKYRLYGSLKFMLKFQNDKIEYEEGKVTFTISEELKSYQANGKSLLDDIKEHFEGIGEGPKSFIVDPIENSDDEGLSFVLVPELNLDNASKVLNNAEKDERKELLCSVVKAIKKAADAKDVSTLSSYVNVVEAIVICAQPEEDLSMINELTQILTQFIREEDAARGGSYPTVPIAAELYNTFKWAERTYNRNISDDDYKIVQGLISKLNLLKSRENRTAVAAKSDGIQAGENILPIKEESDTINSIEVPTQKPIGNNGNEEGKMNERRKSVTAASVNQYRNPLSHRAKRKKRQADQRQNQLSTNDGVFPVASEDSSSTKGADGSGVPKVLTDGYDENTGKRVIKYSNGYKVTIKDVPYERESVVRAAVNGENNFDPETQPKILAIEYKHNNVTVESDYATSKSVQKSKLPTIAISILVIAAVASLALSIYLEMLTLGVIGACCLVAAVIVYCCKPAGLLKDINAETPAPVHTV